MPHSLAEPRKLALGRNQGGRRPQLHDLASNQGGPKRIELLNAARIALEAEAQGNDAFDNDAFCEEHSAIFDALSFERPNTAGEIGILLNAAGFHLDMLLNGVEEEESATARQARGEKV